MYQKIRHEVKDRRNTSAVQQILCKNYQRRPTLNVQDSKHTNDFLVATTTSTHRICGITILENYWWWKYDNTHQ